MRLPGIENLAPLRALELGERIQAEAELFFGVSGKNGRSQGNHEGSPDHRAGQREGKKGANAHG